jgi:uncharacterized protein (DUF2147 family)
MVRFVAPRFLLLFASLLFAPLPFTSAVGASPTLIGLWLTQGGDGIIAITECGNGLCGHIAGLFLDHPEDPMPVNNRGVSQCGLPLITDARQIWPNLWKGHITDPRNGIVYGVELHLDPRGNLALRGFLGIPLLGQTETWTPYVGTLPADCRITPTGPQAEPRRALPNRPQMGQ